MQFAIEQSLPILERTPAILDLWLRGLPREWTAPNEGPESWSAFDVVGHLIDGEENDWIARARIILAQIPHAPSLRSTASVILHATAESASRISWTSSPPCAARIWRRSGAFSSRAPI